MWLSHDWSQKLKVYFATDWPHVWLPYQGKSKKMKIEREPYIKQIVTDLDDLGEPSITINENLGNHSMDTFFGNFPDDMSPIAQPENW